jgi:hypothetical protein
MPREAGYASIMSAIATAHAKTPAAQQSLRELASLDIEVTERTSGSGVFQVWFHSPAIEPGRGAERLYALIEELYPELLADIVVSEPPA